MESIFKMSVKNEMKSPRTHQLRVFLRIISLVFIIIFLTNGTAHSQFGKNKVQYRTFKWRYIQSDHFDVYYYDSSGYNLARFTADAAEVALGKLQTDFRYRITNRIPIITYHSKNDFQQTNVVSEYMPEGVGGVTELFKNRVVLPFEGDWEKFRHVIHHELVHAFLNDKFYGGSVQSIISGGNRVDLPIWINEGLAEYHSLDGYNLETDMFIRDAAIGEYLPPLERLGGYFAYRGGQAFYWYIERNYGREKIAELINRIKNAGSLDAAIKATFNKNLEEFSEQFLYDLKKYYWPDIADRKRPRDFAKNLTNHKKEESFFNTSPSISPDGQKFAFISDKEGNRSVYVGQVGKPESAERIIEGESSVDFEELHLLTPAIAWSADSRKIALAVKSGAADAIFVVDVKSGNQRKIEFPLDAIYSVDWSPDGSKLAFQGIKGDHSDIYVCDTSGKKLVNITNDIFSDADPNWSFDGKKIFFISDRRDNPVNKYNATNFNIGEYEYNSKDIFSIEIKDSTLRRITATDGINEESPISATPDKILYVSDANGINNIYVLDLTKNTSTPITNSISGIQQLSITKDASSLLFTSWNTDGQDVFLLRTPLEVKPEKDTLEHTKYLLESRKNIVVGKIDSSDKNMVDIVAQAKSSGNVKIDPTEIFEQLKPEANTNSRSPQTTQNQPSVQAQKSEKNASGEYVAKDYKLKFTTDYVQAMGGYSSFYGVQGTAQMMFSDVLGDHQIFLATNVLLDTKNSDFLLSYNYLPEQLDLGIDAFHTARFVYVSSPAYLYTYSRFRQFGLSGRASNPFNRFSRFDLAVSAIGVSREKLQEDSTLPDQTKYLIIPSMSYVFDNSEQYLFSPISGGRMYLTLLGSPKIGSSGVGFYTLVGDLRKYFKLSKYGDYSLGLRAAGGMSFGLSSSSTQKFVLGSVENELISFASSATDLRIQNAEDFALITPFYPLRGYGYGAMQGSKFAMGNLELRFPLFRALITGPIPILFQYMSGVIFLDAGTAWDSSFPLTGVLDESKLLNSVGIGARAAVLGFPVKFDVAWHHRFPGWSEPNYNLSLGLDF